MQGMVGGTALVAAFGAVTACAVAVTMYLLRITRAGRDREHSGG